VDTGQITLLDAGLRIGRAWAGRAPNRVRLLAGALALDEVLQAGVADRGLSGLLLIVRSVVMQLK
jgi:hypothetical protein